MSTSRAVTCCGISELSNIDYMSLDELKREVASALRARSFCVYYSVNAKTTENLLKLKFRLVGKFKNSNSGNTVYILMKGKRGNHVFE